jgi:hypothetical protein
MKEIESRKERKKIQRKSERRGVWHTPWGGGVMIVWPPRLSQTRTTSTRFLQEPGWGDAKTQNDF